MLRTLVFIGESLFLVDAELMLVLMMKSAAV